MLSASIYERDNRVLRYAESLAGRGDQVDVIALGGSGDSPRREKINGVDVFRVGVKVGKGGQIRQLAAVLWFLVRAALLLARKNRSKRYDLIHVHNMPDFLVFAAWWPKRSGTRIILDIHDIFPEFYATRFEKHMGALFPRLLCRVERFCARFSNHVIVSNHLWRDTLVARSVPEERCSVFINAVDTARFYPRSRSRRDDKLVIIYPGSFNWHQGLDVAIRALAAVKAELPKAELHLYGRGPQLQALMGLAAELGLNGSVQFFDPVALDRMPDILANADLGVVPKRASDFFGNQAFSTKIMEFMSQGLPVVASRTAIDTYYYDDSMLRFFESENVAELSRAFVELANDEKLRLRLAENARQFVAQNCWDTQREKYLKLVDSLVESKG
jgi:glycosyltransferase involved in cell wall biosynthesis